MLLIFSNLVVSKLLSTIIADMRNFVTNIRKILEICKQFAGNHVNKKGNVPANVHDLQYFKDVQWDKLLHLGIRKE